MAALKKIKVKSIPKPAQEVKQYSRSGLWLSLAGLLAMLTAILFGGPAFSTYLIERDRMAVDKNGAFVKAMVYRKSTHKGATIFYKFTYKGAQYKNTEGNPALYDQVSNGDVIEIKLDTLDPGNSYITGF